MSSIFFVLLIGSLLAGVRGEDFWEHSAVVRELAVHPWNPRHPLLLIDVPHAFFSPYLLAVGLFARFSGLDSLQALMFAGMVNFVYLVVSLRLFIGCFFSRNTNLVCFYALFFMLFFWPSIGAGMWSGFYHFKVLPYVLPYPATFSMATTFLILALYHRALESGAWTRYIIPLVLTSVVIVTHPTTALFTLIGLGSISMHWLIGGRPSALLVGIVLVAAAFGLTLLWPYFSFFDLIRANNPEFHEWSRHLYERLGQRLYSLPVAMVFALPLILKRLRQNIADALVLMLLGAISVYVLAALTGLYGAGRILSQVAIMLQILLAGAVCDLEMRARSGLWRSAAALVLLACLTLAMNTANLNTIRTSVAGLTGKRDSLDDWRFLSEYVAQYDVVLTDLQTGWLSASFGGKIVASLHPVHWIDDGFERRDDVHEFFVASTSQGRRDEIILKYCASYILLHTDRGSDNLPFYNSGTEVYRNSSLILIRVKESLKNNSCEPVS